MLYPALKMTIRVQEKASFEIFEVRNSNKSI